MDSHADKETLQGFVKELKSGRLLQSFDLQAEIKATNERQALEAASRDYLSRLYTVDEDAPVRYDPPAHEPRRPAAPRFFYSGDGRNHSRVANKRRVFKRFAFR